MVYAPLSYEPAMSNKQDIRFRFEEKLLRIACSCHKKLLDDFEGGPGFLVTCRRVGVEGFQ